jgi:hypothetical protein
LNLLFLTVLLIFAYNYSSVGIVTDYGLGDSGSIHDSARVFSFPQRPDRLRGSPSLLSNGCRGLKRQKREADHSPPSGAEIKKGGAIPPLPNMSSWNSA